MSDMKIGPLLVFSLLYLQWRGQRLAPRDGGGNKYLLNDQKKAALFFTNRGDTSVSELCGMSLAVCAVGGTDTQKVDLVLPQDWERM